MKAKVIFVYDEVARKWETMVTGVINPVEARQAFSAVVITCQTLDQSLLKQTLVKGTDAGYQITPAV